MRRAGSRRLAEGSAREALSLLEAHSWPGNVRELKNAVERAMLLTENDELTPEDFQVLLPAGKLHDGFVLPPGGIDFEKLERDLVIQALDRVGGNQTRAASLLGMNRDQIRYRIDKLSLSKTRTPE